MEHYNPKNIEPKWQKKWEKDGLYRTKEDKNKQKYYILDMFPYPSGAGLHVGHPKGYIATDVFARMKTLQGFNVLHPFGWDAFGLPAENYAIKNKIHPEDAVKENVATFKSQIVKLGMTYDWEREINTTDPEFYKWTQWIFLQLYKKGLAYESNEPIIWCPGCKTGLAAEDLENGACERCDSEVERKPMRQWVLKITDYAERMLQDLEKLPDWDESIKEQQKNWIGKSEGADVDFDIVPVKSLQSSDHGSEGKKVTVFTTRPDTLFGATYFVLAPEHSLVEEMKDKITNYDEVAAYIKKAQSKSDLERTDLAKDKSGVELKGIKAINPVDNKEIPVWVADYVLKNYGTGAIMAVPAHDERDWEFAKKFNLPINCVITPSLIKGNISKEELKELVEKITKGEQCYSGDGFNINSGFLDGLGKKEGIDKMIEWLDKKKLGKRAINYKLQDWVFSRQRYWGEPIPIIHCEKCGTVAVPEKELPVILPDVKNYEPTGTGESPLAAIDDWVNVKCPRCGGEGKRETNTMPQWAGSSWYYLRYIDSHNDNALVGKEKEKYWSPVDFYVGGAEHATRHLIYARFWHKFLFDIGVVSHDEPFTRLQHVGLILAEDGRKMSKRWGNVINPDDVIKNYGADAMRVYEMFMGPFSQPCVWNMNGIAGTRRFLEKIWRAGERVTDKKVDCVDLERMLHKTIKKVGGDIESFKFNTAIAQMMIMANELEATKEIPREIFTDFLKILAPFAPHMAEELWSLLGEKGGILSGAWPAWNADKIVDETVNIVVQVNGKVRETLSLPVGSKENEVVSEALKSEKVVQWLDGNEPKKVIYVKDKLLSLVV